MRNTLFSIIMALCLCSIGVAVSSCESDDCMLSTSSYCYFGFYDGNNNLVKLTDSLTVSTSLGDFYTIYTHYCDTDTVISLAPIDSLIDKGYLLATEEHLKTDTLVNRQYGADHIQIPFSYTEKEDTFFLMYSKRLRDTLIVKHDNTPYFISMDCGTVMNYSLIEISSTNYLIDSIQILDKEVTNTLKENVKIYFTVSN